jgi:STE24 endopeptidase
LCATGIRTFIDALEKVARLNGISRHRPGILQSWQHSTIARRVDFLQRVQTDPSIEPRFQRTVKLVKWGVVLVLAVALAVLVKV